MISSENSHEGVRNMFARIDASVCRNASLSRSLSPFPSLSFCPVCLCTSVLQLQHHFAACYSMLQCVAMFWNTLQRVAACCSALQCVAVRCRASIGSALQCVAVYYNVLQYVAVRCSVLQCVAVRGSAAQCGAVRCSALQCVAVHTHAMRLFFMCKCDKTHSYVWHDWFIRVTCCAIFSRQGTCILCSQISTTHSSVVWIVFLLLTALFSRQDTCM